MQWLAVILGLLGLLAMPRLWRRVRRTTLTAPWRWALGSGIMVLAVAVQGADDALLNYTAGVTTLLPAAAIYGAKRPQDRGWQWIVAALLVILLLPVGDSYFLGNPLDLAAQPLRTWFLVVLLAVQGGNWIVTANAGPVLLLTAAQLALLWPQLPWGNGDVNSATWLLGAALSALVPWWLVWNLRMTNRDNAAQGDWGYPSPAEIAEWKSFRAAYGVVWALRVTERINEVAKLRGWPWRWSWSGATACDAGLSTAASAPPDLQATAEEVIWRQLWTNIFRRFLDPETFPGVEVSESNTP